MSVGHVPNPFEVLAREQECGGATSPAAPAAPRPETPPPSYDAIASTAMAEQRQAAPRETLSGKQVIVLVDVSKHMKEKDIKIAGVKFSRWDAVRQEIGKLCADLAKVDKDGIDIVLVGNKPEVTKGVTTAKKVEQLIDGQKPHSYANITAAIDEAKKLHFDYKAKPGHQSTVVLVLTAAEATSSRWFTNAKKELKKSLVDVAQRVERSRELGILFIQVGNDKSGKKMLSRLDNMDGTRHDVISEVSFSKIGYKLDAEDLVNKALIGC